MLEKRNIFSLFILHRLLGFHEIFPIPVGGVLVRADHGLAGRSLWNTREKSVYLGEGCSYFLRGRKNRYSKSLFQLSLLFCRFVTMFLGHWWNECKRIVYFYILIWIIYMVVIVPYHFESSCLVGCVIRNKSYRKLELIWVDWFIAGKC